MEPLKEYVADVRSWLITNKLMMFNDSKTEQQFSLNDDPMMDPWFLRLRTQMECFRIKNELGRKFLAEYLGTCILVMFHNGSIAQSVLSGGDAGDVFSTNWGATVGLIMAIHWGWNVSGGHVNPAVSLGFAVVGKFPLRHVPLYALAQCLGAFTGSVIIYGVYADAINSFDGGNRQVLGPTGTGGIFCTYPQPYLSLQEGFFDQIVGTALLMSCILAVVDSRNNKPIKGMEPFVIGLILHGIGVGWGLNHGYAINPSKDFSQRLFTYIAQYGSGVWTPYGVHWWWVPIVGPFIGSPIGAWIYYWLIEFQHPPLDGDLDYGSVAAGANNNADDKTDERVVEESV